MSTKIKDKDEVIGSGKNKISNQDLAASISKAAQTAKNTKVSLNELVEEVVNSESENQKEDEDQLPRIPKSLKRDEFGLLENIEYKFKENGFVDWRKMINPNHMVLNLQYKDELQQVYQKNISDLDVKEVDDKYLLVLLAGFKELAQIRGYQSVSYKVNTASSDYVSSTCGITWIPNFETKNESVYFESMADAGLNNLSGFMQMYPSCASENRSFVRSVRNFLNINIVGKDEIGGKFDQLNSVGFDDKFVKEKQFSPSEPHGVLQNILKEKNKPFDKLKDYWVSLGNEKAKEWNDLSDIPTEDVFLILDGIKKIKK